MKKRLLITSIVMMLVVAVALSTATYAWFTSSAQVTSTKITLTAATNSAASLGISWTDGNYGPSITAASPAGDTFNPACPETLTNGTTLSTVDFFTATASSSGGDMVFNTDVAATDVYTWSEDLGEEEGTPHTSFFVKNLSTANDITKKINITLNFTSSTGTNDNLIRVGVFKKDGATYKLLGVLAKQESYTYTVVTTGDTLVTGTNYFKKVLGKYVAAVAGNAAAVTDGSADYVADTTTAPAGKFFTRAEAATNAQAVYGTVQGGNSVNALQTVECVTSIDITENEGLARNTSIELVVLVWEDGVALGDAEGGATSNVGLNIDVGGALDPVPSGD